MSYIGHYSPLQLFPDNVRDDIVPSPPQVTFVLSQSVPGGYEGNVLVIRRKFEQRHILTDSAEIEFDSGTNEVSSSDPETAQLLSRAQVGEVLVVSGAVNPENNGNLLILSKSFTVGAITFVVQATLANETGGTISISKADDGPWEVLEPEVDYTISGVGPNFNKEITFSNVLEEEDQCYVIHRGSATYNLVPTNNSVGPEQLSQNLRNFVVDRFEGDGSEDEFILSQEPINGKAILVTVDGDILDGDDPMAPPYPYVGDWELVNSVVVFHSPPILGAKIRVLHLGFSTVSRRAALSDGQIGVVPPNTITSLEIANDSVTTSKINNLAVTTAKIANDAVTQSKVLLDNNQPLRGKRVDNTPVGLVRINAADETVIQSATVVGTEIAGTKVLNVTASTVEPETTDLIDLGTSTKKFKDVHVAGDINFEGLINGVSLGSFLEAPVGSIIMTAAASADAGWLLCQGQAIDRTTYSGLFSKIGTAYGPGDGVTTFNIPDLRQRLPIGQTTVPAQPASTLGSSFGSIDHTHTLAHTHNVSVSGTLPDHTHAAGTLSVNIEHYHHFSHNHRIAHTNLVPRHFHHVNGGGLGTSVVINSASTNITIEGQGTSTPGNTNRVVRASAAGGANNTGMLVDPTHTHSLSGTVGRASGGGVDADLVPMYTDAASSSTVTTGYYVNDAETTPHNPNSSPACGPALSGHGSTIAVPNNKPQTSAIIGSSASRTPTGSTGSANSLPGIASTGSTTSQSTSTSSANNPPCLVVNFMIKT